MKYKSVIVALLTLLFIFPALAGAAAVGKLTSVEGKVDITSPGKEARAAREGDALDVGDIIRAKSKSRCEVTFGDGNILRLAENTRLKITHYMFEKDKRDEVLNLFRGKIQNVVQKVSGAANPEKAGRYEIHTPTAVAGVRGTNFFAYHQSGVSGAIFKEGTGYGYSINRPQEVRTIVPGQAMVVTSPNQPPTVRPATTQEMEQHQKETAPAEKKAKENGNKKDGDDKKTGTAAAKTDDAGGKKDDKAPKTDEAKKAGDNGGNTQGEGSFQQLAQQILANQPLTLADTPTILPTVLPPQVLNLLPTDVKVVFTPPDTTLPPDMKAAIYGTGSVFTHTIDKALFTGFIKTDGSIGTVVGGAMTSTNIPVDAAGGRLGQGTFTNGTAFAGYFMGVPASAGTAMALVRSIYVTGAGDAGFLSGPLVGSFLEGGDAFGGVGTAKQEPKAGTTSIAPADLEGAMNTSSWTFARPHFGNITVGGASAPLSITAGTAEGEVRGITLNDGKKIGVFGVITNGGTYQNLSGSAAFSGNFGDSGGTFLSGQAYHLFGFTQGGEVQGLVTLWGDLYYLDRDDQGKAKFDYFGYNAGGTGGFRSIMAGNIILSPLAWSANIVKDYNNQGLYTVDGTGIHQMGDVSGGLAGSAASPWSGATSFAHMGKYLPAGGRGPYVWTAPIYSYNYKAANNTTYDGGAFFGLIGGLWQDDGGIDARVYATYVSPTGKAGILKGRVGGAYFSDVSMYRDTGEWTTWTPAELGSGSVAGVIALSAGSPRNTMTDTAGAGALSTLSGSFSDATGPTGSITRPAAPLYDSRMYGTADGHWGLWQTIIGGTYAGTPSDTWYLGTDYHNDANTLITGTETTGSKWSAAIYNGKSVNKILGDSRGFAADIVSSSPFTWVSAGETVGSFDPTAATPTWQAVQTMVGIETKTFLNMAADTTTGGGRDKLLQLNIPAIEVGKANLAGTYSGLGNGLNVQMNNVTFFANSTGGPRIWGTNSVTGSYDSAYNFGGVTVPLSGNGLNANFNVKTWDTANGKWLSTVTSTNQSGTPGVSGPGTGTMNGLSVNFRGAAAGTMSAGNLSGTAAGTAK